VTEKCFMPSCLTEGVEEFEDRYAPGGRFKLCAEHASKLRVMTTTGPAVDLDVYLELFFPLPSEAAS
jgi:hypothetical protein